MTLFVFGFLTWAAVGQVHEPDRDPATHRPEGSADHVRGAVRDPLRAVRRGEHRHRGHAPVGRLHGRGGRQRGPATSSLGLVAAGLVGARPGERSSPSSPSATGWTRSSPARSSTSSRPGSPGSSTHASCRHHRELNEPDALRPDPDPGPVRHPDHRPHVLQREHLPVHALHPHRAHPLRALLHALGPPGARRRRAPARGRHGRHQRRPDALPERDPGRHRGRHRRRLLHARLDRQLRAGHDRRSRVHRPGGHDLRRLDADRGVPREPRLRLRRCAAGPPVHPQHRHCRRSSCRWPRTS